jgi:hypothetical protein
MIDLQAKDIDLKTNASRPNGGIKRQMKRSHEREGGNAYDDDIEIEQDVTT